MLKRSPQRLRLLAKNTLAIGLIAVPLAAGSMAETASAIEKESATSKDASKLPGAPRLLPIDTVAYVRLDNADDLRKDLVKSSMGRMINDPKMRPFADQFYATARDLFDNISAQVGVSLDELLSIPHGQVAIAVHPAKPMDEDEKPKVTIDNEEDDSERKARENRIRLRENYSFGGVLIVDAGKNIDDLMTIVENLEDALVNNGRLRRIRKIGKTELTRFLPKRAGRLPIEYFEKEGTLVIGVGNRSAQDVLDHWTDESEEQSLADNANFGTIISRCIGAEDTRPQLTFFVDPHAIADRLVKRSGSITAGLFWPTIEDMGVARIGGIGSSSFQGGDIFEGIAHYHIKIDPPRDGVLGALRPETGETQPPKWVPEDIAGYTSINWDFAKTYENVGKVIDRFQGADSLKRFVEQPMEKRLGVKLQSDVMENLTGRMVRVVWMQKPIVLNSGVSCLAFEMKDTIKAKSVLTGIRDKMPNQVKVDTIGGHVVYRGRGPGDRFPKTFRRPEPSLMILGKWLIYADSTKFLEKAALASAGNLPRLSQLPEYDLVTGELGGKLDGQKPFLLSFIDGVEGIRLIYDMAKDPNSQKFIRSAGEKNIVAKKFAELLENNELPPFSEFEKYFAPSGMFGYDEPDGIHFGLYSLRAEKLDE